MNYMSKLCNVKEVHSQENIGRKIVKTLNLSLHKHASHIMVQENDDQQIKKNIRLKFPEFSLSYAKFSNSLSFPCREFLLAIFRFPCSVDTLRF